MWRKKDNFVTSCSFTIKISYILGIGDRHLENILIKDDGTIFNIDFEYLLGSEPSLFFKSNSIKITLDMIDAMGEDVTIEDADGNVVAEIVDLIKPEPMTGWKQQVMADIRPENQDYFQEVLNLKKQTWGMS